MNIGEIYIINFPFTDGKLSKQRPVLIISKDQEDYEVLFITTIKQNNTFKLSKSDFEDKGLNLEAYIRLNKGLLFSKSLFNNQAYVGKLKEITLKNIYKQIVLNYSKLNFDNDTIDKFNAFSYKNMQKRDKKEGNEEGMKIEIE